MLRRLITHRQLHIISTDKKIVSRIVGRARPQGEGMGAGGAETGPRWGQGLSNWELRELVKFLWEGVAFLLSAPTSSLSSVHGAEGRPGLVGYGAEHQRNSFILECE